jgi:hypothetical protein
VIELQKFTLSSTFPSSLPLKTPKSSKGQSEYEGLFFMGEKREKKRKKQFSQKSKL